MENNKNIDTSLLLLRLTVGGLLLFHGLKKLEKPKESLEVLSEALEEKNLPTVITPGVYVGEVIAPIALIAGFKTRLFAPIIVFNLLTAIYTVSYKKADQREDNGAWGLETQTFFLVGATVLTLSGGGIYSLTTGSKWD